MIGKPWTHVALENGVSGDLLTRFMAGMLGAIANDFHPFHVVASTEEEALALAKWAGEVEGGTLGLSFTTSGLEVHAMCVEDKKGLN